MAAPVIAWSAEAVGDSFVQAAISGTTWNVGDLCLIWVCSDGDNTISTILSQTYFSGTPRALTIVQETSNGSASFGGWLYRWIDGTEATTGVIQVQCNESERVYCVVMQITGVGHEFPLIIPAAVAATTQNPNPPAIPALKEARDVLYLAATAHDHTDTWSSDPTGYTTVQNGNSGTGSGDCGGAVAYRAILDTSIAEDPGTFGNSGSEETIASTIAVLGNLSPVVAEQYPVAVPADAGGFGTATGCQSLIVQFVPRENSSVEKIAFYAGKQASPTDDVQVSLRTTYNGANAVTSGAVDVQATGWYEATFATPYAVTAGTTYWIVFERTGALNDTNYYFVYCNANVNPNSYWTAYSYFGGTSYTEFPVVDYSFQARKTSGVEWIPVDPMGASGFFGT